METATSLAIQQGVNDGRFDCGITYTEGLAPEIAKIAELYHERYVILVPEALAPDTAQLSMSWSESAALPLILLETEMQNRRIIDSVYREASLFPSVVAETNGFMAAVLMAAQGLGATIVPDVLWKSIGTFHDLRAFNLVDPELTKSVSLIVKRSARRKATVDALKDVAIQ